MKAYRVDLFILLCYFTFVMAMIVGWVKNVMAIIDSDGTITGMLIGRVIGVFVPPIGSILGWL